MDVSDIQAMTIEEYTRFRSTSNFWEQITLPDTYDYHRARYIATGEDQALWKMLEHVTG